MRRRVQQSCGELVVFILSTAVYVLTADRSVSWWDCGEFITVSNGLWVGHPPGAPLYQLVAHLFCLLAPTPGSVAFCCNLLSALVAGATAALLYSTILLIDSEKTEFRFSLFTFHFSIRQVGAAVGALCYAFCHTAWFSAVESEVYALAMLFCSLTVWITLRWSRYGDVRRLYLVALLLGLGVCVHLMTLLTLPAIMAVVIKRKLSGGRPTCTRCIPKLALRSTILVFFFLLGLTPYVAVPLMAKANPPINEGNPAMVESFRSYIARDQYAKAPLYPRMWRERDGDREREAEWSGGGDGLWANLRYYVTYQLGYMYGRYILDNFGVRERDGDNKLIFFIIPLLLAIWGLVCGERKKEPEFSILKFRFSISLPLLLFLFGGPILNIYLNHPCYEPRERDYAYVLSFYAVAMWIGFGATDLLRRIWGKASAARCTVLAILLATPLWMCAANWQEHDCHNRHAVHDIAFNHLQSCDNGAILFAFGDNDTFPLWELHHVEGLRPDMSIHNINLIGYARFSNILADNNFDRPVYLTQYAYDRLEPLFRGRLQLEGYCWRLMPDPCPEVNAEAFRRHMEQDFEWHDYSSEYLDHISRSFLKIYSNNVAKLTAYEEAGDTLARP